MTIINHPPGLALAALDGLGLHQLGGAGNPQHILDLLLDPFCKPLQYLDLIGEEPFIDLNLYFQSIQISCAINDQQVVGFNPFDSYQDRLDLGWEDIDAADDEHVVGPAAHAVDTDMGATTDAWFVSQAGDVAGTVADQRDTLFGYSSDDQLTQFTLCN